MGNNNSCGSTFICGKQEHFVKGGSNKDSLFLLIIFTVLGTMHKAYWPMRNEIDLNVSESD